MASTMACSDGSPIATITITSRKVGVVWNSSTSRISRYRPSRRRSRPAAPTTMPMASPIAAEETPTSSEARAP